VRLAIGASRGRLVRQVMVESLLLASAGTVVAVLFSRTLSQLLITLLGTRGNPVFLDLGQNPRLLAFAASLAGLTCVLFGLVPAFRASRTSASDVMKASGRVLSATRERFGLRQILVASQVALSFVLLVSALLFTGSFRNLLSLDAGFRQSGLLVANIDFSRLQIPPERRIAFKQDLLERIRQTPGVVSAAAVDVLPLSGASTGNRVWIEGPDAAPKLPSNFNWISDGYIRTMGMTLISGRDFNTHDAPSGPRVAIVNQVFADQLGLGPNPVGKRFRREATPAEPEIVFEIVGFVANTKYNNLRNEFTAIAFLPTAQTAQLSPFAQFLLQSGGSFDGMAAGIKNVTQQISPLIGANFRVFETSVREGLLRERLLAAVSGLFGALAAVIAAIGLYGVMSYIVVQRTSEIGIRAAFGATQWDILSLVMRNTLSIVFAGIAVGIAASLALTRFAATMLFGLAPGDPFVMAIAIVIMVAVALIATYLPARRACRVDPMVALRRE
jgi:predicted permease